MGRGNFRPSGSAFLVDSDTRRPMHDVVYVELPTDDYDDEEAVSDAYDNVLWTVRAALKARHFNVTRDDRLNGMIGRDDGKLVTERPLFNSNVKVVAGLADNETTLAVYVAAIPDDEFGDDIDPDAVSRAIDADAARIRKALIDAGYDLCVPTSAWTSARVTQ